MERSWDAIVVGAGPAGSMAALELARAGARVSLLEASELPRYKTCGGALVGRALGLLPAGVESLLEVRCLRAELHLSPGGPSFSVSRDEPVVAMAMRAELDRALALAARDAGAALFAPCRALGLRAGEGAVELSTTAGPLRAAFAIGADGAASRVASSAGWGPALEAVPALEWELPVPAAELERFAGCARFDFGGVERGYAWVFPKRAHLSVGILRMRRGRAPLAAGLEAYLARLGLEARAAERHGWMIPVRPRPGGPARGRVLLAGDAAGLADPLTGEGISFALASGRMAGAAVARALSEGAAGERAGRLYRRSLAGLHAELGAARMLAALLYARPQPEWLLRRFGRPLCEAMVEVISGHRTCRGLLASPASYARLLRRERAR